MPKQDRRVIIFLAAIAVFCVGVLLLLNNRPTQTLQTLPQPSPRGGSGNYAPPLGGEGGGSGGSALHVFDPNTIDSASLVSFGLPAWKVKNFIHYRRAGKVFRTPDDLLDTYGWEPADLDYLLPYIRIGSQYQTPPHPSPRGGHNNYLPPLGGEGGGSSYPEKFRTLTLVDVNTADTTLLQRIPGIGSYYSRSIVRLREKLGGLHSLEQLFEIRDFPEGALEWFEIKNPQLRKLNVNTADFKTLASHPYIGYDRTKLIQRRVRLYGPFQNEQELIDANIFTEEDLEPLRPYLTFE
ncbi:MAG: helix-hairpin-helix domain-containing protein [Bacteroidaceae bacterium]|nr:helix-hairpin-helix domain-containing protein [Bacteroidaceae bacterium]